MFMPIFFRLFCYYYIYLEFPVVSIEDNVLVGCGNLGVIVAVSYMHTLFVIQME
jgi:hypothetical protein